MKQWSEKEALAKISGYCSETECCRFDAYTRLKKWGLPPDETEHILQTLEKEKFIDEERYCRSFVNDKFRFNKWGKVKIAQALYMKSIPSAVAWKYLNEIDADEYLETLRTLLQSKRKSLPPSGNSFETNQKLIRFALSRGFEMKDVLRFVEEPE